MDGGNPCEADQQLCSLGAYTSPRHDSDPALSLLHQLPDGCAALRSQQNWGEKLRQTLDR